MLQAGSGEEQAAPPDDGLQADEEAIASKEVEEHNVDHGVFRQRCPRCEKGRAESYGHRVMREDRDIPVVSLGYMHLRSEQDQEEETGMPTIAMKDSRTKMVLSKVGGTEQRSGAVCRRSSSTISGAAGLREGDLEERQ